MLGQGFGFISPEVWHLFREMGHRSSGAHSGGSRARGAHLGCYLARL